MVAVVCWLVSWSVQTASQMLGKKSACNCIDRQTNRLQQKVPCLWFVFTRCLT